MYCFNVNQIHKFIVDYMNAQCLVRSMILSSDQDSSAYDSMTAALLASLVHED